MFGPIPFWQTGITFKFITSVTSEASTIVVPESVVAGRDLFVLADAGFNELNSELPANTIPTDFTSISTVTAANNSRQTLSYKIAEAGDAGATLTGITAPTTIRKALAVLRCSRAIASVTVASPAAQATENNPAAQTVAAAAATTPGAVIGAYGVANTIAVAISPRTFTIDGNVAKEFEIDAESGNHALWLVGKCFKGGRPASDVVVDMDDEAVGTNIENRVQSCFLQLGFA